MLHIRENLFVKNWKYITLHENIIPMQVYFSTSQFHLFDNELHLFISVHSVKDSRV